MTHRLDALRSVRTGEHIAACVFSNKECVTVLAGFVSGAVSHGRWALVIADDETFAKLRNALSRKGVDASALESEGRLALVRGADLPGDSEGLLETLTKRTRLLERRFNQAGRMAVRLRTVNDQVTADDIERSRDLWECSLAKVPASGLWIWDCNSYNPDVITRVLRIFPFLAVDLVVARNVFHVPRLEERMEGATEAEIRHRLAVVHRLADMESALRDALHRFHLLVRALTEGVLVLDETGRMLYANPTAAQLFGLSRSELERRPVGDLFPNSQGEVELPRPDGEKRESRYVRYRVSAFTWRDRPARLVSLWDVTGLRREESRRRLLENAVDATPIPIVIIDEDDSIIFANFAFANLVQHSAETLSGVPIRNAAADNEEILTAVVETLQRAKEGREEAEPPTVRIRTEGGEERLFEIHFSSAESLDDPQTWYVLFFWDVTQIAALREQLQQAERMEAIGQLAGGVAHDFNNLLMVILSGVQFAAESLPADSPVLEDLKEVEQAAQKAAGLTRKLLTLSRKQILQPEVFNVDEAVADLQKMLRRVIPENIRIAVNAAAGPDGRVLMDRNEFDRVLVNLAVNARDAMAETGGAVTISTWCTRVEQGDALRFVEPLDARKLPADFAVIEVRDTGPGIPPQIMSRIWDPFFTTKRRKSGSGTGLGLATVLGAVRQAGGSIEVESKPGHGAAFRIYLPLAKSAAREKADSDSEATAKPRGERILVVEDDDGVRRMISRRLERGGHVVIAAASGEEARRRLGEHDWDVAVVLTDVLLPDVDGRNLAEEILRRNPKVQVIYMTGYPEQHIHSRPSGTAQDTLILPKPFTPQSLERTLQRALKRRA